MRLFIAEKPSLARAIADVLPGPKQRRSGYIECGGGDVVTWCAGHILELAEPEAYRPEYKTWAIEHLPITPDKWKLSVTAPDLFKTIKTLLPHADEVVHAGDPDREGQLLVDEVLEHLSYRGSVSRILVSDLNPAAVRKALDQLQPNAKFRGLYDSARARQRADWLYGLNLTRLYTVLGRAGGHDGILSVGRVQTPLLGLIVRRDLEIEGFTSKPYFVLTAEVTSSGGSFAATWVADETAAAALDDEKRLVSRSHADALVRRCSGQPGHVAKCSHEKKTEPPSLPYSLAELQVDAGKRLGLTPKETLDTCQALYETHRLTTYPRSDCSYLPEGHFAQASVVLEAITRNAPGLATLASAANPSLRSKAWADSKVTAHHAIIPTPVARASAQLPDVERRLYLYSRETGQWSVDPELGPIVVEIFTRISRGETCDSIARDLQARAVPRARPSKSGRRPMGAWILERVHQIARARTYLGSWVADKTRGLSVPVPRIVSDALYAQADEALRRAGRRGQPRNPHKYLLQGIAACALCGGPIGCASTGTWMTLSGKRRNFYYVCRRRRRPTRKAEPCVLPMLRSDAIDDRVWSAIVECVISDRHIEMALADQSEKTAPDAATGASVPRLGSRLRQLIRAEEILLERFGRGFITEAALDKELVRLKSDRTSVERAIAEARRVTRRRDYAPRTAEALRKAVSELRDRLRIATAEDRREVVRAIVARGDDGVKVGPARIEARIVLVGRPDQS